MLFLKSFASSSKGNSHIVIGESGVILVDVGISCKKIIQSLQGMGKCIDDVLGIVITHTHIDHIKGFQTLSKNYTCTSHLSRELFRQIKKKVDNKFIYVLEDNFEEGFQIGDILVKPFEVLHDADPTYGYTFEDQDNKVAICTDIGCVTNNVITALQGSTEIIIEANYDPYMLENGPYPMELIERIKGILGHLSNEETATLCEKLVKSGTNKIILAHLSETNNKPEIALEKVKEKLKNRSVELSAMFLAEEIRDERN